MPLSKSSEIPEIRSRQEMEQELFAQVKRAEAEFRSAGPNQKPAAGERYRAVLDEFNTLILGRRPPASNKP
jgi:hypothetical protein